MAVPEDVLAVLEAEADAFGLDMRAVARKVLQEWADRRAHAFSPSVRRRTPPGAAGGLPR